jgi:S1-C subfamily serine protease
MLSDKNPTSATRKWFRQSKWLRGVLRRLWPIGLALLLTIFGMVIYSYLNPTPIPISQQEIDESVAQAMASATPPAAFSSQVYQTIFPSLVIIQSFSENNDEIEDGGGVGSGVIINANAEILTALHVVSNASEIKVVFADGTQSRAEIIAAVPENDIAVLQSDQTPSLIVPAILGNPNAMRIGDETFAVGNPMGLIFSMSAGVISGFDRSLPDDDNGIQLEGLIQFDAAVNPGNSGGPLLNRSGQVIGIVTALANPAEQRSFAGIGFAVPITVAGGAAGAPAR